MTYRELKFDPGTYSDLAGTPDGRKMWEFLQGREIWIRMETATYLGRPALEAIQPQLLHAFPDVIREDRWKQMVGRMVRQVMEFRGYQLDRNGVRLKRNELFMSASRYIRKMRVHEAVANGEI